MPTVDEEDVVDSDFDAPEEEPAGDEDAEDPQDPEPKVKILCTLCPKTADEFVLLFEHIAASRSKREDMLIP